MMAENSSMGFEAIYFFNTGALIWGLAYFLKRYLCDKASFCGEESVQHISKTKALMLTILNAVICVVIFTVVTYTFKLAISAGINVGLVVVIWAINPFTSALMDYLVYGQPLFRYHIVGMTGLLICAVLVAVGTSFGTESTEIAVDPLEVVETADTPAVYAILCSVLMPVVCTF
jgi:drug/metabolite transporter (DMT)-like permease